MNNGETITFGWVDSGLVHSDFVLKVLDLVATTANSDNPIVNCKKITGHFIGQNRDLLFNQWLDANTDWLLMVDSDIVLETNGFIKLINSADKNKTPILSGIYFIGNPTLNNGMHPITSPIPSVFTDEPLLIGNNELQKIQSAGLGLILIHRSAALKLKQKYNNVALFDTYYEENNFIPEDVSFFNKVRESDINIFVNPAVIAGHMKYVNVDINYFMKMNEYKNANN